MGTRTRRFLIAVGALVLAMQLVPLDRSNPPVQGEVPAPSQVLEILRTSCYDCHSNRTVWPWYAYVAPVSYLVVHDVHEGRGELNFTEWGRYDSQRGPERLHRAAEEVSQGDMPPANYLLMHRAAILSEEERRILVGWASSVPSAAPRPAERQSDDS